VSGNTVRICFVESHFKTPFMTLRYSTDSGERESRPFREEPETLLYFN